LAANDEQEQQMEHWRTPYLGLRDIPPGLDSFELATFFSYSAGELQRIARRHQPMHRLAMALQMGFIRMTGRTLDAFERIPKRLWTHIAGQIGVEPPEIATLRSLYAKRERTLADHQALAYKALGFQQMTEHQRRYVVRWLREALAGRANASGLLPELKRWFYEHRILLIADRELKRFIAQAARDREAQLLEAVLSAYGAERLGEWDRVLAGTRDDGTALQTWLAMPPLKQSTVQIGHVFDKIGLLRTLGVDNGWPAAVNDAAVRHYARRCANRSPAASRRITSGRRALEAACFLLPASCAVQRLRPAARDAAPLDPDIGQPRRQRDGAEGRRCAGAAARIRQGRQGARRQRRADPRGAAHPAEPDRRRHLGRGQDQPGRPGAGLADRAPEPGPLDAGQGGRAAAGVGRRASGRGGIASAARRLRRQAPGASGCQSHRSRTPLARGDR